MRIKFVVLILVIQHHSLASKFESKPITQTKQPTNLSLSYQRIITGTNTKKMKKNENFKIKYPPLKLTLTKPIHPLQKDNSSRSTSLVPISSGPPITIPIMSPRPMIRIIRFTMSHSQIIHFLFNEIIPGT